VESVVAESVLRQTVESRRRDGAAESTRLSEADIIQQNEQDIWRTFGSGDSLGKCRYGIFVSPSNDCASVLLWPGQYF
jgi:hypothetical protein